MLKNTLRNSLARASAHKYGGPDPVPTKSWHKIVIDIVSVLVIFGFLAWFVISLS